MPEDKIHVVYQAGMKLTAFAPPTPPVTGRYLLYVGMRAGYKNFDFVARGFASLGPAYRDIQLVCCGGLSFTRAERALFESLGVADRLLQFRCTDRELAGFYAHATAFVFPSLYEGFGIPPLEAMAHGCPVIVSRSSSLPEVVGEAGVYFDPTNQDDFRAQLERIVNDAELRASLVVLGGQRASEFTWDRCFRDTLAVYRSVIG